MSSMLSPEDLLRLDSLFERAADLPPAEQKAFLERECGSNAALRRELAHLLEGLAGDDVLARFLPGTPLRAGTRIGSYVLQERIGQGGMGEVYAAEQHEPLRRRVALKLIRSGLDSEDLVKRFLGERQALARMAHPHVAQVFEAGATEEGRPYFVMEYVEGTSITNYCDTHALPTRKRLELFLDVCEGVQHAHQKGIIHRDLKPSNLLVAEQDGRALVKVIDFGVARAIDRGNQGTLHTLAGQIVGTLDYMSPEQADPGITDLDTRSDLYSLGVVLYQLVSGLLPFEHSSSAGTPVSEVVRTIREEDPPTPSVRLRRSTVAAAGIAALRGTDERVLVRQLAGDLDWICLKALEKDPARRYASASELAEDVRRHLAHEPVMAGPPGVLYRTGKFVRRNRTLAGAILAVLAALVGGLALSLRFGLSEAEQRRRAEESSYRANLSVTLDALEEGNYTAARTAHERAPEALRNWEWRHLDQRWVRELARLELPGVARASFLDESRILAIDREGGFHVWDALTGERTSAGEAWPAPTFPLALAVGGRLLLGFVDGELLLGDPLGAEPPRAIPFPGQTPLGDPGLCVLARGTPRAAVAVGDGRVSLVGAEGILARVPGERKAPLSIALDPSARHLAVRWRDKLCLWSLDPVQLLWTDEAVYGAVAFAPDGATVVAELQTDQGAGTGLFFKDVESGRTVRTLSRQRYGAHHLRKSGELVFSADQSLLALTFSHAGIFLLDARAGKDWTFPEDATPIHRSRSGAVGFAPYETRDDVLIDLSPGGGTLLSLGVHDQTLRLWRTGKDGASRVQRGHVAPVRALAFSPDGGTLASGADDGSVRLWNTASDETFASLASAARIDGLAFLSQDDARQLACLAGEELALRDLALGRRTLVVQPGASGALACSRADGRVAVGTQGGEIRLTRGEETRVLAGHEGAPVTALAFSADGRLLASGTSEAELRLWDPSTGACLASETSLHAGNTASRGALALAFAPDGQRLAVGWGDATVSLLEVPSLTRIHAASEHRGAVFAVGFSPDGTRLASGGGDGYLRLWDAATGEALLALEEHGDAILTLAFSPDGRRLATGSRDRTVRIWDSQLAELQWRERGAEVARRREAEACLARLRAELGTPEAVLARLRDDARIGSDLRRDVLRALIGQTCSGPEPGPSDGPR